MSSGRTTEAGIPHHEALRDTLKSSVRCAIMAGLTLHDVNGHAPEWCRHLRNEHGDRPTTDDFFSEWTRQLTELSRKPSEVVDDE